MQEEHGISLDTQEDMLEAYCKLKGFKNIKKYIDVGSARNTNRANFQHMMLDIERGKIKRVIIMRLDRLTRSIVDLNKLLQKLKKYNCDLHSATENIDTATATGRMVINLIATFAQWESETISERVIINMMTNARKGKWQGITPFGYYIGEDGRLKIKEDEAKILHEAFDLILKQGYSFTSAEKIIAEKYNLNWYGYHLRRAVRKEYIIGNIYRNGEIIENTHEGIITKRERQKLLERLDVNKSPRTSADKTQHKDLFRRKIKCYRCNYNLSLSTRYSSKDNDHYYHYRCNNCRHKSNYNVSVGENKILEALKVYFNRIIIDDAISAFSDEESPIDELKDRLQEIEVERDRIQRAWIKQLMSDEDLERYQRELDDEKMKIESELMGFDREMSEGEYAEVISTLKDAINNMTRDSLHSLIQQFIKKIEFERYRVDGYKKKYDIKVTNVEFY